MRTEVRFLLAIGLMLLVLVGTNLLFPPIVPEPVSPTPDSVSVTPGLPDGVADTGRAAAGTDSSVSRTADAPEVDRERTESPTLPQQPAVEERTVVVEGPLYRYVFSNHGAELREATLPRFRSLRTDGPVQLIPEETAGAFGHRLVVGSDTLDLRDAAFEVEPAGGLTLTEGGSAETLRFSWRHPSAPVGVEIEYRFEPDSYLASVRTRVSGLDRSRPLLVTDLGHGLQFTEADSAAEASMMAYVTNAVDGGIQSHQLQDVDRYRVLEGPFVWTAFKSKFFVLAALPGREGVEAGSDFFSGVIVEPEPGSSRAHVAVAHEVGSDGTVDYRVFVGPQEYGRLSALGDDLEEVNPYGWRFFRPIIRPFVGVIMTILNFLHDTFSLGYGWVLILFGILMRVLLWPFYMKSMRAQMNNMAVQPLLKEIQTKYKDNPERMQKEMMRLHKEYGFNPVAGCLPMLLPWPVLIALFFVFQNAIELRGVDFLWLPDLSAKDPLYILPVFLAVSMFLLQFISYRSLDQDNPQMKMMMYVFPLFFGFIFMQFPSGLNLYYATANIATIPQQVIVARERKKAKARGPVKREEQ